MPDSQLCSATASLHFLHGRCGKVAILKSASYAPDRCNAGNWMRTPWMMCCVTPFATFASSWLLPSTSTTPLALHLWMTPHDQIAPTWFHILYASHRIVFWDERTSMRQRS